MNLAVFELFPCLLSAKQNEIKGLKETEYYAKRRNIMPNDGSHIGYGCEGCETV